MAKGVRSKERELFWREVMKRFATSGSNVREFCRAESLSEASFYAWRRELRLRDGEATQAGSVNHSSAKRGKQPLRRTKGTSAATPVARPARLVEVVPQAAATSSVIEIGGVAQLALPLPCPLSGATGSPGGLPVLTC